MNLNNVDLRVYLVDDDEVLLKAISQIYELDGVDFVPISSAKTLLDDLSPDFDGVIVTDVRMPGMGGIELFNYVTEIDPEIPVIFITGHADVPMVLNTLREGAFDFFSKPLDSDLLLASTHRALEKRRLVMENRRLRELAQRAAQSSELIGETVLMRRLRTTVQQVAKTDVDVLIEGETGTGKEVVASLIHQWSDRSSRNFVSVNCAALQIDRADVELFGSPHDSRGQGAGARVGKIEASHNGTLFLDEIECLTPQLQGRLLPVVEDRQIASIFGDSPKSLNLRILVSSQIDLSTASEHQEFRSDLLYRLNTVRLRVPPLRDRKEDVPLLFAHFVKLAEEKFSTKAPKINSSVQRRLFDYDWPGNVRELKNFSYSFVLNLDDSNGKSLTMDLSLPERVERFEENTIRSTLEQTKGDVRATLDLLNIPRKTFYDKLSRHCIDINKYRNR